MHILILGATGTIGRSVAAAAVAAGHDVRGTARSPEAAAALAAADITPVEGRLEDPDRLRDLAREVDAVINVAQPTFEPGTDIAAQLAGGGRIALGAAQAIVSGLAAGGGNLLWTSGAGAYGDTGDAVATEETPTVDLPFLADLAAAERTVLAGGPVRGVVIRPAIVYGAPTGPVVQVAALAQLTGTVAVAGPGTNELSFVHAGDLARLYLLALERTEAGTILNAAEPAFVSQRALLAGIAAASGATLLDATASTGASYETGIFSRTMRIDATRARRMGWTTTSPGVSAWLGTGSFAEAVRSAAAAMASRATIPGDAR